MTKGPPILIPAYQPAESLELLVCDLTGRGYAVVIVDDGSGPGSAKVFESLSPNPSVTVLRHAVNLGKGGRPADWNEPCPDARFRGDRGGHR